MSDNIVIFPKAKRGSPPLNMEELLETVETTRKEHTEFLMDDILSFVFSRCLEEGFDLNQDHCLKSTALLVESFRSALYGTFGADHPLHEMAEAMFVSEEDIESVLEVISQESGDETLDNEESSD